MSLPPSPLDNAECRLVETMQASCEPDALEPKLRRRLEARVDRARRWLQRAGADQQARRLRRLLTAAARALRAAQRDVKSFPRAGISDACRRRLSDDLGSVRRVIRGLAG